LLGLTYCGIIQNFSVTTLPTLEVVPGVIKRVWIDVLHRKLPSTENY